MNKQALKLVPLSEISQINPSRKSVILNDNQQVSFIPMSDTTETGRWVNQQVRNYGQVKTGYTLFEDGDVLFAKITPCTENGKGCLAVGLQNQIGFGSTEFHILRANENADNGFIFQWSIAQQLRQKAAASMTGSAGQQRVPASFFYEYKIPKLPKEEQAQIAAILSTIDKAIEQTEAIIAKQQRIKTGLMQHLLTRGIDDAGNLRSEETHEFKESPLGRIPVEWEVCPLRELVHLKHGHAFKGEFFSNARNENILLTPGNFHVDDGLYFTKDNTKYYTGLIPQDFILENGDVLVVMTDLTKEMTILGSTVILSHSDHVLHNQRIGKILFNNPFELDKEFLVMIMNAERFRNAIKASATGTTVRHTSPQKLLNPYIPKIIWDEQRRIVNVIKSINQEIRNLQLNRMKFLRLKTGLMQDLLTGKVRVTDLLNQ